MKLKHLYTYDFTPGKLYRIPDVPYSILWDICYTCNQHCRFCYNNEEDFQKRMPSSSESLNIARKLADWGICEVIILGGEPTLHPHLEELLKVFYDKGVKIRLITNGVNVTGEMALFFAKHNVETGVSLHGINAEIHNYLTRFPLSFSKAIAAIEHLSEANAKWFIQFTPTKLSNTLLESAIYLKKLFPEISCIDINRLMPHGLGHNDSENIFLDEDGWWTCLKQIPQVKKMDISVSVESVPHCWIRKKGNQDSLPERDVQDILNSVRPCYMGINQIAIDDQGRFKLCPGGNSCGKTILENTPSILWHNSSFLATRRQFDFLPEKCVNFKAHTACPHFYECGGGCKMTSVSCDTDKCIADHLIVK